MPEVYDSNQQKPKTSKRSVHEYSEVFRTTTSTRNPLAAFVINPQNVSLDIQQKNEAILMILRRHVLTNLSWILVVIAMVVAPFFVAALPVETVLPERFGIATLVLWYLLTLAIAIEGFLSWYFQAFIITDERIIDVDFLNLIYKNVSAAKIDNIEDVTVQMGGALRSVLNFGTVEIQTSAEKRQFEFEDVPHPQKVAKFLNELMLEEEREQLEGRVS